MANTDQPHAEPDQPHPDTALELEVEAEQAESRQAFVGLWVVLGVIAVVILGTFVFFSHRAHTPALSPGQPEKPAVAMLGAGAG
ncbi:MAG TPA: hypothetical protein VHZ26_12255 [Caulobacteraceae bacterium]|jgi:hypothetical protein|nr:hypothetical protein [Caulobacteraceae bacterium]